jgi:hypothetical protein
MAHELPELPHAYTEGDRLPSLVVAFEFDISTFTAIVAAVERPDGTAFERAGVVLNANQVEFLWQDTDWIPGCSQLTVRTEDALGLPSHVPPIIVSVREKPTAPTP